MCTNLSLTWQFHHNIGILLYYSTQGQNIDGQIFSIVDQINHSTINDPQLQIEIAQLNYKAASKALNNSNFAAAYFYSNAAIKLLPPDHWECHYDLSRGVFLVQGNAAYTDGREQDATEALDMILLHGKSLKDKLDAYHLKISLVSSLFLLSWCAAPLAFTSQVPQLIPCIYKYATSCMAVNKVKKHMIWCWWY